jgi:glycosyltransferase involved in cell wall biosynthesis
MKKILFMNDTIHGGGAEKVMEDIIRYLPKKEYAVTILTPEYDDNFYRVYDETIQYIYINKKRLYQYNLWARVCNKILRTINVRKIIKYIKIKDYDIAIAFKEGPCMSFVSSLKTPKKLAWIHIDYNIFHWTNNIFREGQELKCMKRFEKVVCVSRTVRDGVIKCVGDPGNLYVLYNPIDRKDIIRKSQEEILGIKPPEDRQLFITVGRLTRLKGYDRLLKACNELNKMGFRYELWFIGEGEEEISLKDYANNNNMENIKFLGLKNNPYPYVRLADWFICSSISESFGLAIQEAIALGVPVITTYCPGACELIREDIHGIVVENSEEGIQSGMKKALSEEHLSAYFKEKIKNGLNDTDFDDNIKDIVNSILL